MNIPENPVTRMVPNPNPPPPRVAHIRGGIKIIVQDHTHIEVPIQIGEIVPQGVQLRVRD